MKKTLVALAAFAAASSYAGVTIDGYFDAGYQSNTYQGVKVSGIAGNGAGTSAINFRGNEDLGGGLVADFHFESDFNAVTGSANTGFAPTNVNSSSTVLATNGAGGTWGNGELSTGLTGGFGAVHFGNVNNAGLEYVSTVSNFGTAMGGGYGSVIGAQTVGGSAGYVRWNNSMRYDSPVISGFQASVVYAGKQNLSPTAAAATVTSTSTLAAQSTTMGQFNVAGAQEVSARYTAGPLKLLAVNSATNNTTGTTDTQRDFAASYAVNGALTVQAGMQNTNYAASTSAAAYTTASKTLGAKYVVGQNEFVGNYTTFTNNKANMNTATEAGIGYNYLLSKTTKVYLRADHLSDSTAATWASDASIYIPTATTGQRTLTRTAAGVGIAF